MAATQHLRDQTEEAARLKRGHHKAEVDAGIYQMLGILLFFACFGPGLFIAKIIDDLHGPWWGGALAMAISTGVFLTCLKRLGQERQ